MSRPLKTGLDYFPHDTDAADDDKIQSLMALYGCEGYSFYFILLERIYRTENGVLPMGKPIEKAGITRRLCMTIDRFDEIMGAAIEVGCFDPTEYSATKSLTSEGIRKRIERIKVLREKERLKKESIKDKYKRKAKPGKTRGKPPENSESGIESHSTNLTTRDFIAKYCESFKAIYGKNPVITEKDSGISTRLIKIPDILTIMKSFFESTDKFITDNCHSLNIVESQLNKLSVTKKNSGGVEAWVQEREAENATE